MSWKLYVETLQYRVLSTQALTANGLAEAISSSNPPTLEIVSVAKSTKNGVDYSFF